MRFRLITNDTPPLRIWIIDSIDIEPGRLKKQQAVFIPHYLLIKSTARALHIVVKELDYYI
jgi:hypothetical protein